MRMGGGGGGSRGWSGSRVDEEALRRTNAEAPDVPHLWRRVAVMFRPYRARIVLTVVLVVVGSAAAVIPPLLVQRVFDDALFPPSGEVDLSLLGWLVGLMVVLFVASALLGIAQTWLTSTVGNSVAGDLRMALFERLQAMDLAFFTRTRTGIIQSRLLNDVAGVSGVLTSTVTSIVGNTVTVGASLAAMVILDWRLTLIAVVIMPGLVAVQRRVGQIRARIAARTQESLSELTAITQESLSVSGILLSKTFHREEHEARRYREENHRLIGLRVRQALSGQGFFALVTVVMSSVPAFIYLAAGLLITRGMDDAAGVSLTAGTVVAFTAIQGRLLFPLMSLMRVALEVQTSRALFARIFEYLDLQPTITDSPEAISLDQAPGPAGQLEFRDVGLRYPDAPPESRLTLRGVSLVVRPGEHHALVGPSGAGKSSLLHLAARLHEATEGQVMMSGADVRDITRASLMEAIGVVTQETYLFHASIADNVRYARPDATDAEIAEACRAADIHHVIESFEEGYDTIVGERGHRLSGGERQRVAIARVLLKDPRVLLLDEATSALDTVSEAAVRVALERAAEGRTTLTIAHRLTTVVDADCIHVVKDGTIVESGTHAELLEAGGEYATLARQLDRDSK